MYRASAGYGTRAGSVSYGTSVAEGVEDADEFLDKSKGKSRTRSTECVIAVAKPRFRKSEVTNRCFLAQKGTKDGANGSTSH